MMSACQHGEQRITLLREESQQAVTLIGNRTGKQRHTAILRQYPLACTLGGRPDLLRDALARGPDIAANRDA
ncbi:MAG: hypothetical protein ACLQFR_30750 [Streptosporangiaceae bacterium]